MKTRSAGSSKITLGIVDDSPQYREALVYYFSQIKDIEILFECSDGAQLLKKIRHKQPQVVLLDVDMPNVSGIEALQKLRHKFPSVKFIMLTMYMENTLISSLIEKGANSYLNKSASGDEIYQAIVKSYEDDFFINDWISNALVATKAGRG